MMDDLKWDADMMLIQYIHDYMIKKKLYKAAETLRDETKITFQTVALGSPEGFLSEWWSIFSDVYRYREKQAEELSHQNAFKSKHVIDPSEDVVGPWMEICERNEQRLRQLPTEFSHTNMPTTGMLAAHIYVDERVGQPSSETLLPDIRLASCGKMASCNSVVPTLGNVHQQACAETQQRSMRCGRQGVRLSSSHPSEPTFYGVSKALTGLSETDLNKGITSIPLSGWPLAGIDQIPSGLGKQVLKSYWQQPIQQQFQMLAAQHRQELIAQSCLSGTSADLELQKLMLLKGALNMKDEKMRGGVGAQHIISSSTGAVSGGEIQEDEMMFHMRQITDQQRQKYRLQKQELPKGGRKRKELSDSVAACGTMAGGTPWNQAESLMPVYDKMSNPTALIQNWKTSGKLVSHGCDRSRLAETSGKDGRHNVAAGSSYTNLEAFLSRDTDIDDLRGTSFSTLLQTTRNRINPKGFSFGEVFSLSTKSKVLCCHFSSDGKLLASAGHDKKVVLLNLDNFESKSSSEDHCLLITDVRFGGSSNILATSSFDKTVQIWDTNDFNHSLCKLIGHSEEVMSLDFHPKKMDLLCSCDRNEIRLWNVSGRECTRTFKGGAIKVRFQPQVGQLLAAASGNAVNILDVETGTVQFNLKGHTKEVQSICWDTSGKYIASVSEDRICVWSALSGGGCVHELCSSDNKFQSCIFHPQYPLLLIVGGYQSLELWNPTSSGTKTFAAHGGLITALANSPSAEMIASGSHDGFVKLWK